MPILKSLQTGEVNQSVGKRTAMVCAAPNGQDPSASPNDRAADDRRRQWRRKDHRGWPPPFASIFTVVGGDDSCCLGDAGRARSMAFGGRAVAGIRGSCDLRLCRLRTRRPSHKPGVIGMPTPALSRVVSLRVRKADFNFILCLPWCAVVPALSGRCRCRSRRNRGRHARLFVGSQYHLLEADSLEDLGFSRREVPRPALVILLKWALRRLSPRADATAARRRDAVHEPIHGGVSVCRRSGLTQWRPRRPLGRGLASTRPSGCQPPKDIEFGIRGNRTQFDGIHDLQLTDLHISRHCPSRWAAPSSSDRTSSAGPDRGDRRDYERWHAGCGDGGRLSHCVA